MTNNAVPIRTLISVWIPVLAWMAVIFLFSNQAHSGDLTKEYLGDYNVPVRKLAHAFEYALLCLLARRALGQSGGLFARHPNIFAIMLSALYALSDEYHQSFVPGRSATITDAGVDTLGAFFALALLKVKATFSKC
jgi:VanZ family protein